MYIHTYICIYICIHIHTYIYVASWLERSPEEGNGIPLQYSCMRNPMNRGAWWVGCSSRCCKGFDTSQQLKKNSNIYTDTYIERQTERQRERQKQRQRQIQNHDSICTRLKPLGFWYFIWYFILHKILKHFSLSCTELSTFCTSYIIFPLSISFDLSVFEI